MKTQEQQSIKRSNESLGKPLLGYGTPPIIDQ